MARFLFASLLRQVSGRFPVKACALCSPNNQRLSLALRAGAGYLYAPNMRRAKIVATIGPATDSPDKLRELLEAGVDVVRVNMSHGEREHHAEVIARVRQAETELKRPVSIMLDISGPKIRTGNVRGGRIVLRDGQRVTITTEEIEGDENRFSANYSQLPDEVQAGDRILLSDGELELRVESAARVLPREIVATVVHGGVLGDHKGINLPGAKLSIPSITEKDEADLKFGLEHGIDLVALSFVRSADDCSRARDLIRRFGGSPRLIAKIEKPEAVGDLDRILDVADGVMVARGDLAVETSPELVPILQKKIITAALCKQKTVITATQMLQSMIENPAPTRAEASDVANAILDGSDAVMLSGETAVGRFPCEAVKMMSRIVCTTEEASLQQLSSQAIGEACVGSGLGDAAAAVRQSAFGRRQGSVSRAIAEAAVFAADEIGSKLIVVFTVSGHMARRVAALRPRQRIIALTPSQQTYRQLAISWGLEPFPLDDFKPVSNEVLASGNRALLHYGLAQAGELVIFMAGEMPDSSISTSMKLHRVSDISR